MHFLNYSHKDNKKIMPLVSVLLQEYRVEYDTNLGAVREYNDQTYMEQIMNINEIMQCCIGDT